MASVQIFSSQTSPALTALAPMQDVTDQFFINLIAEYGSPDYYFTEYFRVHETSTLQPKVLRSITENASGRPIFAQLIGESIPDLVRTARLLLQYPVAGIDLNLGCPAPRIYRKNVGGGLLREPERVAEILDALRQAVDGHFSVKMRIGFGDTAHFEQLLELINQYKIDLLSLHGRTVKELYHGNVHYDLIAQAVQQVNCPVLANGNITSAVTAATILAQTGAAGVMVGRSAIRNPWIFKQIRQHLAGEPISPVTLGEVREYVERLRQTTTAQGVPERARVGQLKMYLNYVAPSVDAAGAFLREMRLSQTESELLEVCDRYLLSSPDQLFALEPYPDAGIRRYRELAQTLAPC